MVGVDEGKLTLTPLKSAIKGTSKINSELLRVSEIMNT
jgi:6-phosphofructokinase 1